MYPIYILKSSKSMHGPVCHTRPYEDNIESESGVSAAQYWRRIVCFQFLSVSSQFGNERTERMNSVICSLASKVWAHICVYVRRALCALQSTPLQSISRTRKVYERKIRSESACSRISITVFGIEHRHCCRLSSPAPFTFDAVYFKMRNNFIPSQQMNFHIKFETKFLISLWFCCARNTDNLTSCNACKCHVPYIHTYIYLCNNDVP